MTGFSVGATGRLSLADGIQNTFGCTIPFYDLLGNELILFTSSDPAVNYLELTSGTTGNVVGITAMGDDAAVGVTISSKGTGSIKLTSFCTISSTGNLDIAGDFTGATITMTGFSVGATGIADALSLKIGGTERIDSSAKLANFQGFSGTLPTRSLSLSPASAIRPTTNPMESYLKDGTNHTWVELRADDTTDESVFYHFIMPDNYGEGNVTLKIHWTAATVATTNVIWQASLAGVGSAEAYDQALDDATGTVTTAAPGTAGQVVISSITLTAAATWNAGDIIALKINRDADNVLDTYVGDISIVMVEIEYGVSS